MSPSSLSRPVFWFMAAAFIFFGIYFSWTALHTRIFGYATISDLQKEFSTIDAPPNARRSGDVLSSSKVTVQAVYADYLTKMKGEEIARYYEAELMANGWKQVSHSGRVTRFCKADIDAVLEFIEETPVGIRYYFGLAREDGPGRRTGCQG